MTDLVLRPPTNPYLFRNGNSATYHPFIRGELTRLESLFSELTCVSYRT